MAVKALTAGVLLVNAGKKELKKHQESLSPTYKK